MTTILMLGATAGLIGFLLQLVGITFKNWQWWAIAIFLGFGWAMVTP